MKLIKPSYQILTKFNGDEILRTIEQIGRICYKSEDKITEESNKRFCSNILQNQHLSVIEHVSLSIKFVVDRGVSHELVRHRLCSFSQESTRYCNYKSGVTFIIPSWVDICPGEYTLDMFPQTEDNPSAKEAWCLSMLDAEKSYLHILTMGWNPQQARSVLPNSLKTEICTSANLREWRHILKLRTAKSAHPQMQEIMRPLLKDLQNQIPIIFDDL